MHEAFFLFDCREVYMADIHILTPEELQQREQKPAGRTGRRRSEERTRFIEAYKAALQNVQSGFGGDVVLAEGEQKRVVRNNLKEAAKELNLALSFRPIRDPMRMHFRVITPEEAAQRPQQGG
jgi:hypothetical protein